MGLSASLVAAETESGTRPALDRIVGDVEAYLVADGLESPDGIAIHPVTREIYVTEETAGRVAVIRNGKAVTVINGNWQVSSSRIPSWAITPQLTREHWTRPELRSPEGIAFSADGLLYVLEDAPGGRLLEFQPEPDGTYKTARVLPIPWTSEPYAWEGITVAADGRIFIAGSSVENLTAFSGAVLMRDLNEDWWIVDYGPFAPFSSVALSRDEDILIVAEEGSGGVTWWDAIRQREIQTVSRPLGNVEGVTTLPDGSIVAAQESAPNRMGGHRGRLVRIDPSSGEQSMLAEGFGAIETVLLDPKTGYLYVTEDGTGSLLEIRPAQEMLATEYLLQRTVLASESSEGLPPKKWPPFLKGFFNKIGVTTVDENVAQVQTRPAGQRKAVRREMTLQEVGERVPLVAGKVKMNAVATDDDPDPVVEISFIHFFPNQVIGVDNSVMPGLCLFAARHQSGKIERNRPMLNMVANHWSTDSGWNRMTDKSSLYLPLTTCSAMRQETGVAITMCFLGLEFANDYYLNMNYGSRNSATLTTDLVDGQTASCEASFVEADSRGNEVVNLVMTGFMPRRVSGMGWLNIGTHNRWSVITPERGQWISRWITKNMPQLAELARKRNSDILLTLQVDPRADFEAQQAQSQQDGKKPTASKEKAEEGKTGGHTTQSGKDDALPTAKDGREMPPTAQKETPADDHHAHITTTAGWGLVRAEDIPLFYTPDNKAVEDDALTNLVFTKAVAAWHDMEF